MNGLDFAYDETRNCEQLCFENKKFLNKDMTFFCLAMGVCLIICAHKGYLKLGSVWLWAMK
jgi:hypothetical protein